MFYIQNCSIWNPLYYAEFLAKYDLERSKLYVYLKKKKKNDTSLVPCSLFIGVTK